MTPVSNTILSLPLQQRWPQTLWYDRMAMLEIGKQCSDFFTARSPSRTCNAHSRFDGFPLLHNLDTFDGTQCKHRYHWIGSHADIMFDTAIRRRLASRSSTFPSTSLGHSHSSDTSTCGRRGSGKLPQCGDDQEQQEEGTEGKAEGSSSKEQIRAQFYD